MINLTFLPDRLTIGNVSNSEYAGLENVLVLNDTDFIFSCDEFVILNPDYLIVKKILSCYECTMIFDEREW